MSVQLNILSEPQRKPAAPISSPAIELRNVTFSYGGGGSPAVSNASVTIGEKDFACLIGPNGGGKTTLVKMILGLLQPTEGTVRVFGLPPEDARRRIGYMPQYAKLDLQFPVNVLDVVLMGRLRPGILLGHHGQANRIIAERSLEEVGLAGLGARPFAKLSGGQRQRVLIARALACEPDLLILDEPTSNLDIAGQNDLYELMYKLNKTVTLVIVSHDVAYVSKFVRTVLCVNRSVDVHDVGEIAGDKISEMYGRDMRMILHDHSHKH